jgi:hypothetical protein
MYGIFKLHAATMDEIIADRKATREAIIIVIMMSLIISVGLSIGDGTIDNLGSFTNLLGLLLASILNLIPWIFSVALVYFIGVFIVKGNATFIEVLRVVGYVYVLQVLTLIPYVGMLISFIWAFLGLTIAARQVFGITTRKAAIAVAITFTITIGIGLVLALLTGHPITLLGYNF